MAFFFEGGFGVEGKVRDVVFGGIHGSAACYSEHVAGEVEEVVEVSVILDVYYVRFSDYVGCFGEVVEYYLPAQQVPSNVSPDRISRMETVVEEIHRRSI